MLGGLFTLKNIKRISTVSNNSQSTQNVRGNIINNENNNMSRVGLILFVSFCFQENMPIFTYDWNALGWHKVDKMCFNDIDYSILSSKWVLRTTFDIISFWTMS